MTATHLPAESTGLDARPLPGGRISARTLGTIARGKTPSRGKLMRRRWAVGIVKRALPLGAVALLASIAFWPEISGENNAARFSYRRGVAELENGLIVAPRYRGVDQRNRPYTMTATSARQVGPDRIDLVDPKGDLSLESGSWLMSQSKQGVYLQKTKQLDLSGDVTLYRDDGTTLTTSSAALDLAAGAAAGSEMTHVEGPFGTLDAQGFALVDKGAVIQFPGPSHLVLNSTRK